VIAGLRRRLERMRVGGEAGFTLIDLLVAMTIMSVVMAVFTIGMLQMYAATNRTVNVSTAQAEINRMYLRLERSIRYASAITTEPTPALALAPQVRSDGNFYIQYLTNNVQPPVCQQLRLNRTDRTLQYREWNSGTTLSITAGWQTLVSNVYYNPVADPTAKPRKLEATGFPFLVQNLESYQRLQLEIWTIIPTTTSAAQTKVTFTALNSTATTNLATNATTCVENRPA
jgi:type II secretory pathway component PulJ